MFREVPTFKLNLGSPQTASQEMTFSDENANPNNMSITIFDANTDSMWMSETRLSAITPEDGMPNQVPAFKSDLNKRSGREISPEKIQSNFFTFHSYGPRGMRNKVSWWPKDSFLKNSKSNAKNCIKTNKLSRYSQLSPHMDETCDMRALIKRYSIQDK